MKNSQTTLKRYEDLTIRDNFIFQKVMQKVSLCKTFLEKALNIRIKRINFTPIAEKSFKVSWEGKASRLDLYVELEDGTIIDVEVQTTGNAEELAKRTRYYQSIIDADNLTKGTHYAKLPPSYVIFICTFDPFGENRYAYTFQNRCFENTDLLLKDDTQKVFFNAKGKIGDVDEEIRNFLRYIDDGEINGDFVQAVASEVKRVKQHKETRVEYMGLELALQEREILGREEGRKQNAIDSIRNLMETLGLSVEKAMDALKIPQEERAEFLAAL